MSLGRIKIIILMGIVCIGSCTGPRYLKSVGTTVGLKPEIEERPPEPFLFRPRVK